MTPIYFPFTWIDAATVQAITAVFPRIALYRPSAGQTPPFLHPFKDNGALEIRVPIADDGNRLQKVAAEYQEWAKLHKGDDLALLNIHQSEAPFTEALSSMIESEILHYQEPAAPVSKALTNARLFLEIAAEYDRQQCDINHQLEGISDIEKRFMAATGGETEKSGGLLENFTLPADDPGDYMTRERLQAWALLALQDQKQRKTDDPLITFSPVIIRWLQDEFQMEKVLQINGLSQTPHSDVNTALWREAVSNYIGEIQTRSWPFAIQTFEPPSSEYAIENAVSLNAFIIVNQSSDDVLHHLAGRPCENSVISEYTRHGVIIQIAIR